LGRIPRIFFPFGSGEKSSSFSLSGGKQFFLKERGNHRGGQGRKEEREGEREG